MGVEELSKRPSVAPEQVRYANILFWGSWGGIFILVISFIIYISGILTPYAEIERITQLWGLRLTDYLHELKCPTGWGWILKCRYGDYLNFIGIAILAFLTIAGFISLIPAYLKKRDIPYLIIVIVEIAVLLLAASGVLTVGH
jgi:hypothetical protein